MVGHGAQSMGPASSKMTRPERVGGDIEWLSHLLRPMLSYRPGA